MVNVTVCRTPTNPRYLTHRHVRKLLAKAKSPGEGESDDQLQVLEPNEEQLFSFYIPSLPAGKHTITTSQTVTVPSYATGEKDANLQATKEFTVVAPRYKLPNGSIHSVYPPQGHADEVRMLPHVVFNDSHLPWERLATEKEEPDKDNNRIPWLALLVFVQDELRVTEAGFLPTSVSQSTTWAATLTLEDLAKVSAAHPILDANKKPRDGDDPHTQADFIFPQTALIRELFRDHTLKSDVVQDKCSVSAFKFLAHVRNINTMGMANSGIDDEFGTFSIVVSPRTGPLDITQPTSVVVHLVNLEGVDQLSWNLQESRVSLCSLDSWSYTCLPPDSFNVYAALENIGHTWDLLRPDPTLIDEAKHGTCPTRLLERLQDGHTIVKYRTQTGEETAALLRGVCVPSIETHLDQPASNFGTDLQVLDKDLGLMDITYSVAWQLGRTMALADQSFTTALARIRIQLTRQTQQEILLAAYEATGQILRHNDMVQNIPSFVETLSSLPKDRLTRGPASRWRQERQNAGVTPAIDRSFEGPLMQAHFLEYGMPLATHMAASTAPGEHYTEFNDPISPDWQIVLAWVMDRMHLSGIPAQHLIPDPSFLPRERLRFFHIDRRWVDSFVDGALSIANHLQHDDKVRQLIKNQLQEYLDKPLHAQAYPPQIPSHGFLLRSELCTKYPDLIVEAPDPTSKKAPILRQENIDDGVLLVLFDRVPGSASLPKLILRQPPHQQAFAVGADLTRDLLEVEFKRVYTIPPPDPFPSGGFQHTYHRVNPPKDEQKVFVWDGEALPNVHSLRLPHFVQETYDTIRKGMKTGEFTETCPTAALLGIQLNDPMYFLQLGLQTGSPAPLDDGRFRQFKTVQGGPSRPGPSPLAAIARQPRMGPLYDDWLQALPSPLERLRIANAKCGAAKQGAAGSPSSMERLRGDVRETQEHPSQSSYSSSEPKPSLDDPAQPPKFIYKVFPLGMTADHNSGVSMYKSGVQQDLIFYIYLANDPSDYSLQEISIRVPLGPTTAPIKCLAANYRGPGAVMLSNLRYNVIAVFITDQKQQYLQLRIMVRSVTKGKVEIQKGDNLSIALSGVSVNLYSKPCWVIGLVEEKYEQTTIKPDNIEIQLVLE
ncbi:hypothetical protein BGW36DRAFT_424549 [Talaromyces proteolyticus]|uniref:Uncharacterized protein n=1 Tax=Talaromyces proteolyticus TaxID=1131652 RepID=A0AAD4KW16_9EURO|nr:uncharacterized protein BGW36DRAFT_424549 [Talaromyces proteolyticus]KAH8702268.1 hypothetical protein BGW36DRAFT_424549 [Talaromyces proteolyticus]